MSNEVAKIPEGAVLLISDPKVEASVTDFMSADPREIGIPRVRLAPGGACQFDITGQMASSFEAVVMKSHSINTFFLTPTDSFPECFSLDGANVHPSAPSPHAEDCASCADGRFITGAGRKCKWGMRLYLLMKDRFLPIIMNLPVTSVKEWREYRTNLGHRGIRLQTVLTRFAAVPYITKGGYKVSKVTEELAATLSQSDADRISWYMRMIMPRMVEQLPAEEDTLSDTSFEAPSGALSEEI